MKTMLLVAAAAVLAVAVTVSARAARAQEAARAQDAGAKPVTCVPKQKNPERHEQFMKDKAEALKKGPIQLVFIGDSITDAWRQPQYNGIYKERWGKYNPLNIGISGDKTEHVLWRLENGELDDLAGGAKLAVIMIGTNNLGNKPQASPEDTAEGVKCVVAKVREKLPEAKVLLLAVFPRGKEASNPFRAQLKTLNDRIAKLDDGKQVKYLDISDAFLDDDGTLPADVMPDQLHPNLKGYQIWADAVGPTIEEMMK
jgi:lysophospholipase L1-like esterase